MIPDSSTLRSRNFRKILNYQFSKFSKNLDIENFRRTDRGMRPFRAQLVLPPTLRAHQDRLSIARRRRQIFISWVIKISDRAVMPSLSPHIGVDSRLQTSVAIPFSLKKRVVVNIIAFSRTCSAFESIAYDYNATTSGKKENEKKCNGRLYI